MWKVECVYTVSDQPFGTTQMNKLLKTAISFVALCFINVTGGQAQTDTDRAAIEAGRDIVRQEQTLAARQQAQALDSFEPSARRVFLLCRQEDPQCIPLIQKANEAFLDHPRMTYGGVRYECNVTYTSQNDLQTTYTRFMQMVMHDPSVGSWQPWQVVYLTYSMYGGPCSP